MPAAGSGVVAVRMAKQSPQHRAEGQIHTASHFQKIHRLAKSLESGGDTDHRATLEGLAKLVDSHENAAVVITHTRILAKMLHHQDSLVRSATLSALRRVAEEGQSAVLGVQVPDIGSSLKDPDVFVRQKASRLCRVIAEGGGAAGIALHVPLLFACVELNDPVLRIAPLEALRAIADYGGAKSVASGAASAQDILLLSLREGDQELRVAATEVLAAILRCGCDVSLEKLGAAHEKVVSMLVQLSKEHDSTARSAAKRALIGSIFADVCSSATISAHNQQAWIEAFDGQHEEQGIVMELLKGQLDGSCQPRDNMRRLRKLFDLSKASADVLAIVSKTFGLLCNERCTAVTRGGDAPSRVRHLLALRQMLDEVVSDCFCSSSLFQAARDKALFATVNRADATLDGLCAKDLASVCDYHLRKGWPSEEEKDMASLVVGLFAHLRDKDVFLEMYRRGLANRQLGGHSASRDDEDSFVSKLSLECGQHATRKLTAMLADMTVSQQLQQEYSQLSHGGALQGIAHDVKILRTNAWPSRAKKEQVMPCAEMRLCTNAFEAFYMSKFSGRSLSWNYSLGSMELSAYCFLRKHTLFVSTYQGLLLMLFNNHQHVTLKEAYELTLIGRDECKRQLMSMCLAKHRILKCDAGSREVDDSTCFRLNMNFNSDRNRVAISLAKKEEKAPKEDAVDQSVERRHMLDATLVRIMKSNRQLKHNSVVEEVLKQCHLFQPQPQQIKVQIDNLIEREFFKRHPDERTIYIYVP